MRRLIAIMAFIGVVGLFMAFMLSRAGENGGAILRDSVQQESSPVKQPLQRSLKVQCELTQHDDGSWTVELSRSLTEDQKLNYEFGKGLTTFPTVNHTFVSTCWLEIWDADAKYQAVWFIVQNPTGSYVYSASLGDTSNGIKLVLA